MSPLNVLSGLFASACLVSAMPASVLAQSTESMAASPLLAQAQTSDTLDTLETQPSSPNDLGISDLTDDQTAQLVTIFETYQPQIDAATSDYLQTLEVLNDLLVPATSNLALTDARNNVVAADQVIDDLVFQRNLAIRDVLDMDQRQVINDVVRDWLGLGPADTMAVFPMNLIGQDYNTVFPDLQADGWVVAFTTPGEIGLDRGNEKLNLGIARGGEIVNAELVN